MNEIYKTFNLNDIKRKDTYVEETLISTETDYSSATVTNKGYYKKYVLNDNITIYETYLTKAEADTDTYRNYLKFKNLLLDDSSDLLFASEGVNANQGDYDDNSGYEEGDIVNYDDNRYICIQGFTQGVGDDYIDINNEDYWKENNYDMTILSFDRDDHYFDELTGNNTYLGAGYVIGESEFTSRGERIKLMNEAGTIITGYIYTKLGLILFNNDIVVPTLFGLSNEITIGCKRKVYQSIYICNIGVDDFNFTNNGTATDENGEYIEDFDVEDPTVYITTIGLYNNDNELIAVGKFSKPIKKDSVTPLVFSAILEI